MAGQLMHRKNLLQVALGHIIAYLLWQVPALAPQYAYKYIPPV